MAENQNENEVNNTEEIKDVVISEGFVREDLKHVAETTPIFDSLKELQEIATPETPQQNEVSESSPKVYTGKKYRFFEHDGLHSFYDANPSDQIPENPITDHYVKTVNNGIHKGLGEKDKKEQTIPDGTTFLDWQSTYRRILNKLVRNYPSENPKEIQEYFVQFVNALMFEINRTSNSRIHAHARIKSPYSSVGKFLYRASANNQKPINDLFGIKLVIDSASDSLLIGEDDDENIKKIKEFRGFKKRIETLLNNTKQQEENQEEEFAADKPTLKDLTVTEYYSEFIKLLTAFDDVVSAKATKYSEFIHEKKQFLQDKLTRLNALGLTDARMKDSSADSELTLGNEFRIFYDDALEYSSDFAAVLAKYEALYNDLTDYPLLCDQVDNVLQNSKFLNQFGFEIVKQDLKENEKGYKAKFIVLNTPIGRMEIQLQTDNQLREGRNGFNAHDKFKSIPPLPIIPPKDDKEQMDKYRIATEFITSPLSFSVTKDTLPRNEQTLLTTYDSLYFRLMRVIEVAKDSPLCPVVDKYLAAAYNLLKSIDGRPQESLQRSDIIDYLHGDSFKKLKEASEAKKKIEAGEQDDSNGESPSLQMPLSENTAVFYNTQNATRKQSHDDHDDR